MAQPNELFPKARVLNVLVEHEGVACGDFGWHNLGISDCGWASVRTDYACSGVHLSEVGAVFPI